jgi:hypothetical protein
MAPKKKIDIMPRPTKAEQARAVAQQKAYDKFKQTEKSRQYSPAPMSAAAKAKAGARGKATAAKTKPKSTAAQIAKRFGITAREARDIATAMGGIKDVLTNRAETGARGGTARQLRNAVKNVATQYKETAVAAATGKPGKPAKKYLTSMGDNPQTFYGQKKRK